MRIDACFYAAVECDLCLFIRSNIPAFIPTLPHLTHSDICKREKKIKI